MTPAGGWSLSARLGWRLAAVMLAAIALAAVAVVWRTIVTVHELDDTALQTQATMILDHLPARPPEQGPQALPPELVARFRASDGDNLFLVYAAGRLVAVSDPAAQSVIAPVLASGTPRGLFQVPPMPGRDHGMVGLAVRRGPWRVIVLQGREQSNALIDGLIGNVLFGSIWVLLVIGLVTVSVGVITLRRGLRPLRDASAAAMRIRPGEPGKRLPVAGLPREAAPLVVAVNDALARLEQALALQHRFMAEAAHALRTPLAVMTARLDMLDGDPDLRRDTDRMARLVGQLLRIARLEGLPLDVGTPLDLHAVAVEAISALAPLALRKGIDLSLLDEGKPVAITGNHDAVVLALTNLIENAVAHAPNGSTVEIEVRRPASLCVCDRGPGIDPAQRDRVFQRFVRGSSPREGGAGLGLAIVAEIAAAHGGSVSVTEREGGGACFELRLKLAAREPTPALDAERLGSG